jgi:hypothetical protein
VASLPVYVNSTPPVHSSMTKANHPTRRAREAVRFFQHRGPLSLLRRYGARWLLVDRVREGGRSFPLPQVYAGGRYVLYRVK